MSVSRFTRFWLSAPIAVCIALLGGGVYAECNREQQRQPLQGDPRMGQAAGPAMGRINGVAIDRDGRSVWAVDRCSPGTTPGCLGTKRTRSQVR